MAHFHFEIQASATYAGTAPTLEMLVDGSVVSSVAISAHTGSGTDTFRYEFEYSGTYPLSLQFRFNDGSAEGGRNIEVASVRINGGQVDTTYITMMNLTNGQTSSVNTMGVDHLFGRIAPEIADLPTTPVKTGTEGNDTIIADGSQIVDAGNGDDRIRDLNSDDAIFGGGGNDTIYGGAGNDIISGGTGNDILYGQSGDDILHGNDGNDVIQGGDGHDLMNGGAGNDTLTGGNGDDIVYGEAGNDRIIGGAGNDYVYGDDGDDVVSGGAGNDTVYGGLDNDIVYGEAGDDILYGEAGFDTLLGGAGNDTLNGNDGDDTLNGGIGNDILDGGNGNDILIGGAGNDTINGGAGIDTVVLTGVWTDYTITLNAGVYTLVSVADGTDTATLVENFQFSNGTLTTANLLNVAPTGTNATLTGGEDSDLVFLTGNFGFADSNLGDYMSAVRIDSLASVGSLRLNGVAVTAGQVISVSDITAGNFAFEPVANANGSPYASFTFSVRDKAGLYDAAPNTITINITNINDTPTITSNGGGVTASISVDENTTAVTTVVATDPDPATTLTYSIIGGADAARFAINATTGVLTLVAAQNFEAPVDVGANNTYEVQIQTSDGSLVDTQTITVTIVNVNEAPTITSNGGGATASVTINENTTAVTTVTATDPDASATYTYSITGGADAARFIIDASTGVLAFATAPDYELPTDGNGDNIYDVTVSVSDGALTDSQNVTVTVADVSDTDPGTTPGTAAPIVLGTPAQGGVESGGDRDWYGVTLTGGVKYAIWARGTPTEGGTMTDPRIYSIRNSAGTSVNSGDDDGGVGYDSLLYYTPATTGTYYVEMGAYGAAQTGTYTLSINVGGNTYTGNNSGNTLTGTANADYLDGVNGKDTLNGGAGADILDGGAGNDILIGGTGADVILGGAGADTFRFTDTASVDSIVDYTTSDNDILDISNIISGFTAGVTDIDDFLQFQEVGNDTIVRVDVNGATGGANFVQIATLLGTTGLSVQSLYDSGRIDTTP